MDNQTSEVPVEENTIVADEATTKTDLTLSELPEEDHVEVSDILNDIEVTAKLEERLVDLQNIYLELEKTGGINKTLAIAVESISPGLLTDRLPINAYTNEISKTNYDVSLEDVVSGIVATINFLINAIGKILSKVISYIKKIFYRFKRAEEVNGNVNQKTKKLCDEIYRLRTRINAKDHSIYQSVFNKISSSVSQELIDNSTDLYKDLVTGKSVSNLLLSIGSSFNKYIDELNSKVVLLDKAIAIASKARPTEIISVIGDADKYIKNGNADSSINGLLKTSSTGTIAKDLPAVKDYIKHMDEIKTQQALNYQAVFDLIKSGNFKTVDRFMNDQGYLERNLDSLDKRVSNIDNLSKVNFNASIETANQIKSSLHVIKEEIAALQGFAESCSVVVNTNSNISSYFYNIINEHYKTLISDIKKKGTNDSRIAAQDSYANM